VSKLDLYATEDMLGFRKLKPSISHTFWFLGRCSSDAYNPVNSYQLP